MLSGVIEIMSIAKEWEELRDRVKLILSSLISNSAANFLVALELVTHNYISTMALRDIVGSFS
jgi:hypothetical protein